MTDQRPIDWTPPPYQRHSETSKDAAHRIEPDAGTLRARVLAVLRAQPHAGLTDQEMQTMLCMDPSTQRPRRVELVIEGFVRDSGRTRGTKSGRRATVWEVVPE